jgi:transcriptional regulator with XRE-family HTH domain
VSVRTVDKLAEAIRTARKRNGLTQQELADLVAVDREYLNRLERGVETLYFERLDKVLDALGLSLTAVPKTLARGEADADDA